MNPPGFRIRSSIVESTPPVATDSGRGAPWAVFIANIVGSAVIGFLAARFTADHHARPLLASGFCGALTTFSTFALEITELPPGLAVLYTSVSISVGLVAVLAGRRAAAWA